MYSTINANVREGRGKGSSRSLRRAGRIPSVIYGFGVESPISVDIDPKQLQKALENPKGLNSLLTVEIEGGGSHKVLVRELQRHAVSRDILHVDLVSPDPDKAVTAQIEMSFTGKSVGVSLGGRLRTPYREMKVLAKPADFPGNIVIDITNMDIGFQMMASEVPLPEGVKPVFDRDYIVAKVAAPRGRKATAEEDAKGKAKK